MRVTFVQIEHFADNHWDDYFLRYQGVFLTRHFDTCQIFKYDLRKSSITDQIFQKQWCCPRFSIKLGSAFAIKSTVPYYHLCWWFYVLIAVFMLYIKSQATRGLPSMFVSQIVIIMEMRHAVERSRVGEAACRVWSIFTCITCRGFSWCFLLL